MAAIQRDEQVMAESASSVGLAALMSGKIELKDRKVVLVITSRNISTTTYNRLIQEASGASYPEYEPERHGENPGEPGRPFLMGGSFTAEKLEKQEQGKPTLLHGVDLKTGTERVGDLDRIYCRFHSSAGYQWKEKPKG